MVPGLVVTPLTLVPADVDRLRLAARSEGYDLVDRFVDGWAGGTNRFDQPGEVFLEVRSEGRLVAVGGLNRDPYLDDPSVGRIRHVYVHPDARAGGVGKLLVSALVEHARGYFARIRLRAGPVGAAEFYVRLGFTATPLEENATHELGL